MSQVKTEYELWYEIIVNVDTNTEVPYFLEYCNVTKRNTIRHTNSRGYNPGNKNQFFGNGKD